MSIYEEHKGYTCMYVFINYIHAKLFAITFLIVLRLVKFEKERIPSK
jgi:hypothetical protein